MPHLPRDSGATEYHVTKETPPTFLAVADDDKRCAAVCVAFYQALKKAGVAGELHIYARGGHGFGMNDRPMPVTSWTARLRDWMGDSGYLAPASKTASAGASPAKTPYTPPAARIKAPKGFQVELIYSVPRATQGSWVNMTVDPKGRLIVSDQYGKLYRVTLPPVGRQGRDRSASSRSMRRSARPRACCGRSTASTWSSTAAGRYESGLYRVHDTNDDDRLDKVEQLRKLDGGGEHGPHAVILAPDGKSLYVVAGNATRLTELDGSLVPRVWGEDNLHSPHGRRRRLHDHRKGPRRPHLPGQPRRQALGAGGDRLPQPVRYRLQPRRRAVHVRLRHGVGRQHALVPAHARAARRQRRRLRLSQRLGQVAPVLHRQPAAGGQRRARLAHRRDASATARSFRRNTRTPFTSATGATASSMPCTSRPRGRRYDGELEEFVAGTPLALTDVVVNPKDGAMYFAVGGRNTQSGLYRVTYAGAEPTSPAATERPGGGRGRPAACGTRSRPSTVTRIRRPSPLPGRTWATPTDSSAGPPAWRSSFRIRRRGVRKPSPRPSSPEAALNALLALTHVSAQDPAHRAARCPAPDPALRDQILAALDRIAWDALDVAQQLDLLRVYEVVLNRFGRPDESIAQRLIGRFDPHYPARVRELNAELCQLLVYLQAPDAAAKTVALLEQAPTQEEQIHYAQALRTLKSGWTPALAAGVFHLDRQVRPVPGAATASVASWRTSSATRSPT